MKHTYHIKKLLAIFFASILITIIISPLRGIDLGVNSTLFSSFAGLIGYFIFTNFICKRYGQKNSPKYLLISILLGIAVIQIPIRVISPHSTLGTLPDFVVHLLGCVGGYVYYKKNGTIKNAIIYIVIVYCLGAVGIYVASNIYNFNTIIGIIHPTAVSNFTIKDDQGKNVSLYQFRGKYWVVDCWYEGCGVCFQEFPKFQKLCDKYQINKEVKCISLNVPYHKQEEDPQRMIRQNGYTFPVYVSHDKGVMNELGVSCFPTILIFNKESKLIYRGDLKGAKLVLEHYIKE
jgi:peroxiredoxin